MKNNIILFSIIITVLFAGCLGNNSSQNSAKFEGVLTYKVVCDDPKAPEMNSLFRTLNVYIKDGKELSVAQVGNATMKVLCDNNNDGRIFIYSSGKTLEFKHTNNFEKAWKHDTKLLDDSKEINGYQCKYARLSGIDFDGKKYTEEVYYTEQLPIPLNKEWKGLNGFPLQSTEIDENGSTTVTTIQSVSKQELSDSIFNVPNGYDIENMDGMNNDEKSNSSNKENQLYFFAQTTDSKFCSPDSILGSDCAGGVFYLTQNGNVIYQFYCFGNDSTSYDIGTYQFSNEKIICTFDRNYTYFSGSEDCDDCPKEKIDCNSGKIRKIKTSVTILNKLECPKFDYYFSGSDKDNYVLSKADKEQSKSFFDDFSKIHIFSKL